MSAQLIEWRGGRESFSYEVDPQVTGIGRGSGNAVRIEGPLISRFHAQVRESSAGFVVVDLSKNGT